MSRLLLAAFARKAVARDRRAAIAIVLTLLAACASAGPRRAPALATDGIPVWVVGHGWHVGVAVRRADVRAELWREAHEIGPFDHVEFGWGDGDFYPARRGTVALALRAAFRSASSVLHVAAFDGDVTEYFVASPVVELRLTRDGFEDLCRFLAAAYARDASGEPLRLQDGLYGASRFYRARERYRVTANSNDWAARALRAGGVPIAPGTVLFAGTVLDQVAPLGVVRRPW